MLKFIIYTLSLLLAILAALLVVFCVIVFELVVTITTTIVNLFNTLRHGKHRVPEGTNTCL
jgi:hypothetical protein